MQAIRRFIEYFNVLPDRRGVSVEDCPALQMMTRIAAFVQPNYVERSNEGSVGLSGMSPPDRKRR